MIVKFRRGRKFAHPVNFRKPRKRRRFAHGRSGCNSSVRAKMTYRVDIIFSVLKNRIIREKCIKANKFRREIRFHHNPSECSRKSSKHGQASTNRQRERRITNQKAGLPVQCNRKSRLTKIPAILSFALRH